MPKRPQLSDASFLSAVFHPATSQVPSGLRKRSVKNTSARNASRVRAFNKLDPLKQAILDRSGNREKYLRGEISLADARQELRSDAVQRGITKPHTPTAERRAQALANIERLARRRPIRPDARPINRQKLASRVRLMSNRQLTLALNLQSYTELAGVSTPHPRYADEDEEELFAVDDDGVEVNVFWYH